jgi:2-hydroxy-3-keto-5-methylthiopentenyl-1-phosphate phosphatase
MAPIIRAVLSNLVGEDDAKGIDIIANDVAIEPDGKWSIKYRHPTRYTFLDSHSSIFTKIYNSGFGHDKSWAILPYRTLADPPVLFFFGDGVSGQRL